MSLNIFRLLGDQIHVAGLLILLYRLIKRRDAYGISKRSLEIYLLVYCTRYLDLFTSFYSVYNSALKCVFILLSSMPIYWIRYHLSQGHNEETYRPYDPEMDTVSHWKFVVTPCAVMALMTHVIGWGLARFDIIELLWTFSIYLESLAMLPQLVLVWYHRRVERLAGLYIFAMGLYRALYILNWIYRANTERGYEHRWYVYFCGVLQTLLYTDFFFYACTKRDRPILSWRLTVAKTTAVNAEATDPLLASSDEQMRIV